MQSPKPCVPVYLLQPRCDIQDLALGATGDSVQYLLPLFQLFPFLCNV
jgi:hypothetical protein